MSGLEAKELRALKTNMFATKDSLQESFDYAVSAMGGDATVISLLLIHQNTLLEYLAREEEQV